MQLRPRYDGPPLLVLDHPLGDPTVALARQRRRLARTLASLSEEEWGSPSRCEGWSAKDVVLHLNTTNRFWAISVDGGRRGEPTRFLPGFDPVASPAQMVADARGATTDEALAELVDSSEALVTAVAGLDADGWEALAEAPPGHLPLRAVAAHALWDSWVHERDIVLPLGLPPVEEPDEVEACLAYAVALGPAFLAAGGSDRTGTYVVEVTDPDLRYVVELGPTVRVHQRDAPDGALHLRGSAVDVLEALSYRAPLVADVAASQAWMLDGLAAAFDRV